MPLNHQESQLLNLLQLQGPQTLHGEEIAGFAHSMGLNVPQFAALCNSMLNQGLIIREHPENQTIHIAATHAGQVALAQLLQPPPQPAAMPPAQQPVNQAGKSKALFWGAIALGLLLVVGVAWYLLSG